MCINAGADELDNRDAKTLTPCYIKPAVFLKQDIKYVRIKEVPIYPNRGFKMAEKPKNSKERVWAETELNWTRKPNLLSD